MANRIRVGVVGCGRVTDRHLRRMVEDSRVEITLLCDPLAKAAESLAKRFAPWATIVTDENEALDPSRIDAVVLCSPTTLHHRQVSLALERGLDVLVEKPIASTREEARDLLARRDRADRILGVAYQRRFEPIYRTARREIQERSELYGTVREIHVYACERWAQTIDGTWRNDPSFSGGFFADAGSHQIDACFFITGLTPIELRADIDFRDKRVAIETTVRATLQGGAILVAHFVGDAHHWSEEIVIHGDRGDLVLRNGQEIERWSENAMSRIIDQEAGTSPNRDFIDDVVRRIEGQKRIFAAPAECGVTMASWTEAVLKSAQIGQSVVIETT